MYYLNDFLINRRFWFGLIMISNILTYQYLKLIKVELIKISNFKFLISVLPVFTEPKYLKVFKYFKYFGFIILKCSFLVSFRDFVITS